MKNAYKLNKVSIFVILVAIVLSHIGIIPVTADETINSEEKVYCNATLDEDFSDNEIVIVTMRQYRNNEYTVSDFSEIDCIEIRDWWYDEDDPTEDRIILLTLSIHSKENVLSAIKILEKRDDICSAEPNYPVELCEAPNDSEYVAGNQWAINKISLPGAWDETTGSSTVNVGIIDTGIDGDHDDLKNRINTELSRGFTAYASNPLIDNNGHGTMVAGIIGAEGDNSIGVAGTCWSVQLVSLRVVKYSIDDKGNPTEALDEDAIMDAINYADDAGIPILNMSLGWYDTNYWESAMNNYSGLIVCSAGNNNRNNDTTNHYPSNANNLPYVISVGASTENDTQWLYTDAYGTVKGSNYGQTKVDLFAPGASILSTVPGDSYASENGTSLAAPYVTGVAALLLSRYPDLMACEIKDTILTNVDKISALKDLCATGGRLNAYNALTNVQRHSTSIGHSTYEGHVRICTDDARSETIPHSYTYVSNGSTGHNATCTECGFSVTNQHDMLYQNTGVGIGHTGTCSHCGYTCTEAHTWITVGTKYRCGRCAALTTAIPTPFASLPPEVRAKLEQMGYVGDFAMDIGDGTVLCRVGDQYYLVAGQTEETALSYMQNELSVITPDTEAA